MWAEGNGEKTENSFISPSRSKHSSLRVSSSSSCLVKTTLAGYNPNRKFYSLTEVKSPSWSLWLVQLPTVHTQRYTALWISQISYACFSKVKWLLFKKRFWCEFSLLLIKSKYFLFLPSEDVDTLSFHKKYFTHDPIYLLWSLLLYRFIKLKVFYLFFVAIFFKFSCSLNSFQPPYNHLKIWCIKLAQNFIWDHSETGCQCTLNKRSDRFISDMRH